jgi:curli biogenesis system outer membrane secretion channel CsgG
MEIVMFNKIKFFSILLLVLQLPSYAFAKTEEITTTVQGKGISKELAIEDALTRAISQVNGINLDVKTQGDLLYRQKNPQDLIHKNIDMSTNINIDEIKENNSKFFSAEKRVITPVDKSGVRKTFDYKTSGSIKTWKIVSESQSLYRDSWTVKLEVIISKVAKFKLSKEADRKRIVVSKFRSNNEDFSNHINDSLNSFLTQSKKFSVLDRGFSAEQDQELNQYTTKSFREGEIARIGNKLGADYLVVGKILKLNEKMNDRPKLKILKTKLSEERSTVDIDLLYKVLDIATSQVLYSGLIKESFIKNKSVSNIDISKELGSNIGKRILSAIYPMKIVDLSNGRATIAQGGGTLSIGDKYNLIQLGKPLKDPYTGESLGSIELTVGLVEIINTQNNTSTAKVLDLNESNIDLNKLILRPITSEKEASLEEETPELKSYTDIRKDRDW